MSADKQTDSRPSRADRRRQQRDQGKLRGTYAERLQLLAYAINFRRQMARKQMRELVTAEKRR